jgi:hypothetical protein
VQKLLASLKTCDEEAIVCGWPRTQRFILDGNRQQHIRIIVAR